MYRFEKSMTRLDGAASSSSSSLASDLMIQVEDDVWSMYAIDTIITEPKPEGQKALNALQYDFEQDNKSPTPPLFSLHKFVIDGKAEIKLELEGNYSDAIVSVDEKLVAVLARIMVQSSDANTFILPREDTEYVIDNLQSEEGVLKLFEPIIGSIEGIELSEMVDKSGRPIGMVPRKLVHTFNILHRGIGMVVAKDKSIVTPGTSADFPELYVHRRTDTKRIFPSLYDMFVGGVSTAGEDSRVTAAREVAEELGLSRALEGGVLSSSSSSSSSSLSDPLFNCTICTGYNRCFVTVFCFTFDSEKDRVSWQEEEVAWGDFCDYDTIVASADLSIQRLVDKGKWPGDVPMDLSKRVLKSQEHNIASSNDGGGGAWKGWDYVPDGLLVWEAWLDWQKGQGESSPSSS